MGGHRRGRLYLPEIRPGGSDRILSDRPAEDRDLRGRPGSFPGCLWVTLRNKNGVILATVRYDDEHPWPVAPDGAGHSLVLTDTERVTDDYRRWGASSRVGGYPGVSDSAVVSALSVNEVHFDENGDVDWIEIHNSSETAQSVDGYFLSGARGFGDKVDIGGSVPANGFLSFDVGFSNNSVAFLVDGNNVVRSAVAYDRETGRDHVVFYARARRDVKEDPPAARRPNMPTGGEAAKAHSR